MTRRAIAACGLACALVVGGTTSAHADVPVVQVGWWTRAPSPPSVPEGGIAVGVAPDGDLSIGAVLVDAGDGASGVGLRLVETGGQGQAIASIVVCPTTATWAPVEGGPIADAPPTDACETSAAPMTRADDGTWSADLAFAEGQSGSVGFVVKPAAGSIAFQVSFAPPTVTGTVSTSSGSDAAAEEPASEPAPSTTPAQSSSPSFVAPPASTPAASTATTSVTLSLPSTDDSASPNGSSSGEFAAPVFGGVPGGGGGDDDVDVTPLTVVLWYVLAAVVGAAVAGIAWARNEGRLSLEGVAAFVRLRR